MTNNEIKEMSTDDISNKEKELKEELFNLKFQLSLGQLGNTARIRTVRRDIAKLKTIRREKDSLQEKEA